MQNITQHGSAVVDRHRMRYDHPATAWTEALPLGSGKIGIMAFGGIAVDRFQINDETGWSGSPASNTTGGVVSARDAASAIEESRAAIEREDFAAAAEELRRLQHRHSQSFVPFVDLTIDTEVDGVVSGYSRVLDLEGATHVTRYSVNGHQVTREAFASAPDGVAVIRLTSADPAGQSLTIDFTTVHRVDAELTSKSSAESSLVFSLPESVAPPFDDIVEAVVYPTDRSLSMPGAAVVKWTHDGVPTADGRMSASGVTDATIWIATATTFAGIGKEPKGTGSDALEKARLAVGSAMELGLDAVIARQRSDHAALYQRVDLELDLSAHPQALQREGDAVDARLIAANDSDSAALDFDPRLLELLFNYGRYLFICSSRVGGVPANLQGVWNDQPRPMWSSNYTTNINLEMNYWPAEVVGLGELAGPLFDLIDALSVRGRETASRIYGAKGWVAHHNTDPWAYTQPVGWGRHDPRWAFWPMAGAWLTRHLWEHVQFGADDEFLAGRAWPVIRSCAEFYLDWLVDRPDGSLGTSPSTSPENTFIAADGSVGSVDVSSTLDITLIGDLFDVVCNLAGRLGLDDDDVAGRAGRARSRLAEPNIGADGLIREWMADRPQHEKDHRHISHLYFVFPGNRRLTAELAACAGASLDARGGESTGWSVAWKLAVEARLGRLERISDLLALAVRDMRVDRGDWVGGLYPNFFAAHPPFQIDANFGLVAGIAECLLQSHDDRIDLLPSVPRELGSGRITGLIARPGVSIDARWRWVDGRAELLEATLLARSTAAARSHRVTAPGRSWQIELELGIPHTLRAEAPSPKDVAR